MNTEVPPILDNKWPSELTEPVDPLDNFRVMVTQSALTKNGKVAAPPSKDVAREFVNNLNNQYETTLTNNLLGSIIRNTFTKMFSFKKDVENV